MGYNIGFGGVWDACEIRLLSRGRTRRSTRWSHWYAGRINLNQLKVLLVCWANLAFVSSHRFPIRLMLAHESPEGGALVCNMNCCGTDELRQGNPLRSPCPQKLQQHLDVLSWIEGKLRGDCLFIIMPPSVLNEGTDVAEYGAILLQDRAFIDDDQQIQENCHLCFSERQVKVYCNVGGVH